MPAKARAIAVGKPMNALEKILAKARVGSKCQNPCVATSKTVPGNPYRRKHEPDELVQTHSPLIIKKRVGDLLEILPPFFYLEPAFRSKWDC
jgi:hypothetical protein